MQVPKICYSKLFWTVISASFAFTFFTYGVVYNQIEDVKADTSYDMDRVFDKIDVNTEKIEAIKSDVSYIKAKVEGLP